MSLPAMIFAAGFGTRMGALTKTTPKPMLSVNGIPMIDRAVTFAIAANCAPIVVNTHYLADQLSSHLTARWGNRVLISHEPEILDTGGGVKAARTLLNSDTTLTLNADTIWGETNPLSTLQSAWTPARMDALLLLTPVKGARAYTRQGDFFLDATRPIRRGDADSAPFIYAGAQILKLATLDTIPNPAFSLNKVWDALLQTDRLRATLYSDLWIDVGTPNGLAIADQTLRDAP